MDASNPSATTAKGYLGGTASFRTDLYNSRGTLLTLRESIALNKKLGVKHTPELKSGNPQRLQTSVRRPGSLRAEDDRRVQGRRREPEGRVPAVASMCATCCTGSRTSRASASRRCTLDDVDSVVAGLSAPDAWKSSSSSRKQGVKIIAPPIGVLLAVNSDDEIVPSQYALDIKSFGFDIITWSFERADLRNGGVGAGFYLCPSIRPAAR